MGITAALTAAGITVVEVISDLEERMRARTTMTNPPLMAIKGIGPVIGAQLLITAGDNPERLRSSASFAALCDTAPSPSLHDAPIGTGSLAAATGKRTRHCTTS